MDIGLLILRKAPAWFVSWYFRKIFGKKNLEIFKRILELDKWEKVSEDPEKWIFKEDNSFVIEVSNESRDFTEEWTKKFDDQSSRAKEVFLKINNELVTKPVLFVLVDGGRYFVPCPERKVVDGNVYYYWDKKSLKYKIFKRVGDVSYLSFKNLKDFGQKCGVQIH